MNRHESLHRSAPSRTSSSNRRRSTLSQSSQEQETQPQSNNELATQPQSNNEPATQPQSYNEIMSYKIFIRNAEIIGALTEQLWNHHNTITDNEKKLIEDFFSNEIARLGPDIFETTYNKGLGLDKSIEYAHKQIKIEYAHKQIKSDNLKRKYKYFGGKSKKEKK